MRAPSAPSRLPVRRPCRPTPGPGRPRARAERGRRQHPGATARPDRLHPRALRRGRRTDLHAHGARAALRDRHARVRSSRGSRGIAPRRRGDRRLAAGARAAVTALVRHRGGAGTRDGPRATPRRNRRSPLDSRYAFLLAARSHAKLTAVPTPPAGVCGLYSTLIFWKAKLTESSGLSLVSPASWTDVISMFSNL